MEKKITEVGRRSCTSRKKEGEREGDMQEGKEKAYKQNDSKGKPKMILKS